MSREVQIVTWCDYCLADNMHTRASEYAGLNSMGARVTIDLCDDHKRSHLDPVHRMFDTYGRIDGKTPKGMRAPRKLSPASGPCPECGKEFGSAQSLGMHRFRKHGVISPHRRKAEDQEASSQDASN